MKATVSLNLQKEELELFQIGRDASPDFQKLIDDIAKQHAVLIERALPKFSSIEAERLHRKQRLVAGLRLFAKYGYDEGPAGHISVRDPGDPHTFWVNPFGRYFGALKMSDLLLVSSKGEVIEGKGMLNKAAFVIHSRIHETRPDVVAACHAHSMYAKVWSTLGRLLDPITQDSCAFYLDHVVSGNFNGVVYESEEGTQIANHLGSKKAIILRNHGIITVGDTVDSAVWNYITMERCCQAQILAESVGKPLPIDHETALLTHHQVGSSFAAWFSFQPEWEKITKEQPDILSD